MEDRVNNRTEEWFDGEVMYVINEIAPFKEVCVNNRTEVCH